MSSEIFLYLEPMSKRKEKKRGEERRKRERGGGEKGEKITYTNSDLGGSCFVPPNERRAKE